VKVEDACKKIGELVKAFEAEGFSVQFGSHAELTGLAVLGKGVAEYYQLEVPLRIIASIKVEVKAK